MSALQVLLPLNHRGQFLITSLSEYMSTHMHRLPPLGNPNMPSEDSNYKLSDSLAPVCSLQDHKFQRPTNNLKAKYPKGCYQAFSSPTMPKSFTKPIITKKKKKKRKEASLNRIQDCFFSKPSSKRLSIHPSTGYHAICNHHTEKLTALHGTEFLPSIRRYPDYELSMKSQDSHLT